MTEKMKYINLMGHMKNIDAVIEQYISKYDIQLEYTIKELSNEKDLHPIQSASPYTQTLKKAEKVFKMTDLTLAAARDIPGEEAVRLIDYAAEYMDNTSKELSALKEKKLAYLNVIKEIEPFADLDFNIENLTQFKFITYQFGKMPVSSFKQFEAFIYKDAEILFVPAYSDKDYIWGAYFSADFLKDKIDSVFSSLHFEKMNFPLSLGDEYFIGKPRLVYDSLKTSLSELEAEIVSLEKRMLTEASENKDIDIDKQDIAAAYQKIKELDFSYDTRKYGAKTTNDFFIFVGWMEEKDAYDLEKKISTDESVVFMIEDDNEAIASIPPTKLKNSFFARPFEMFVKMYGLPAYDEIDPTPFVAITYTVLFGMMFGDVGQGLVLALLGLYLSKKKGMQLGSIISIVGLSSVVFGFAYGSVFGHEIHPLWKSPAESVNSTTILLYSAGIGIFLIFIAMVLNISNALRKKQYKRILTDPNGIAGFIFYAAALFAAYSMMIGNINVSLWFILLFLVLPLVSIALREPIMAFLEKKKMESHSGLGLFLFEAVIEVFEILLSFFSNTLSFIRVGAFALSHASMMGVVWMLSETAKGSNNILVLILGNLFVMGFEGLIVGIQVLRLEFYEMFSRFYKGTGREFVSYKSLYHESVR